MKGDVPSHPVRVCVFGAQGHVPEATHFRPMGAQSELGFGISRSCGSKVALVGPSIPPCRYKSLWTGYLGSGTLPIDVRTTPNRSPNTAWPWYTYLLQRSLSFAKEIGEQWKESEGIRLQVLSAAVPDTSTPSLRTARHSSYWLLHASNHFNDWPRILARNLLERMFRLWTCRKVTGTCSGASGSRTVPRKSGTLSSCGSRLSAWEELAVPIQTLKEELRCASWPAPRTKAEEVQLGFGVLKTPAYCTTTGSGIFNLSRYAHAGYEVSRPEEYDRQSRTSDFIALTCPGFCRRAMPRCRLFLCQQ